MVHHLREASLSLSPKPFDHPSKICQNTVRRASECKNWWQMRDQPYGQTVRDNGLPLGGRGRKGILWRKKNRRGGKRR